MLVCEQAELLLSEVLPACTRPAAIAGETFPTQGNGSAAVSTPVGLQQASAGSGGGAGEVQVFDDEDMVELERQAQVAKRTAEQATERAQTAKSQHVRPY